MAQGTIIGQRGGSSTGLNVFAQLNEPTKKEGIWIKTEKTLLDKFKYDELTGAPYLINEHAIVSTEDDIYMFGINKKIVKYNILANEYTEIANTQYDFSKTTATANGKDIYLFSVSVGSQSKKSFKFNIETNEFTEISSCPEYFEISNCIETNIYLTGAYNRYSIYKYDILTNEYTVLLSLDYSLYTGKSTVLNEYIYFFGSNAQKTTKYNTISNTCEELTPPPVQFSSYPFAKIDKTVYFFGGILNANDKTDIYKYDLILDIYTKLESTPFTFKNSVAIEKNGHIYLLGGTNTSYKGKAYKMSLIEYLEIQRYKYDGLELIGSLTSEENILINKNIYVETQQTHKIKLTKNTQAFISNAKIYDDNELKDYPAYWRRRREMEFNSLKQNCIYDTEFFILGRRF